MYGVYIVHRTGRFSRSLIFLYHRFWVELMVIHRRPFVNKEQQNLTAESNLGFRSVPPTQNEVVEMDVSQRVEYDVQSGNELAAEVSEPSRGMKSEILTMDDQNPAYDYTQDSMPDSTFTQADTDDAGLTEFFYRPIKIASFEWGTGNVLFEKFNPWKLFFENPRITNRISNFALMRSKLNIKIVINGNGFHYGRAIASYNPLPDFDEFTVDRAFFTQDIVAASQRPHFYLDPTTSQGGQMTLPFFFSRNALRVPLGEWGLMGEMILQSIQPLKHANGASDRVTVSVFAWAEDLTLSMPTSANAASLSPQCGIDPQMGMEVNTSKGKSKMTPGGGNAAAKGKADEYGKGVISLPASVIAKAAGALSKAPVIGPYAKATEMAASATAGIASMFGYSRPAVVEDIVPYKPTFVGNLANTNVPDSIQRLSMDVKQEVTVDPRVLGLGNSDEMSIRELAQRESYVTQFPWAVNDATETLLWNCKVTPMMYDVNPISTPPEIHMTPSCWVTMPFTNWRGSMNFRFQIVSSNYHKGRLKVVYEPYSNQSNEYNTNYTYVLDIAEEKDFSVTVGWGNARGYLKWQDPGSSSGTPFSNLNITEPADTSFNGVIKVYVVNELTVPNSTIDNDISVNVFTSMGDDYEVANPDDLNLVNYTYFRDPTIPLDVQSGVETTAQADADNTDKPSAPIAMAPSTLLGQGCLSDTDKAMLVFFGEAVTSVRQAMKRYSLHSAFGPNSSGPRIYTRRANNLPLYPGYAPGAIHSTSDTLGYNYVNNTVMSWYLPAYEGWRGALRWKYLTAQVAEGGGSVCNKLISTMVVTRSSRDDQGYLEVISNEQANVNPSQMARSSLVTQRPTFAGATATYVEGNPTVEVELPWYSNERFGYAKRANLSQSALGNYTHTLQVRSDLDVGGYHEINGYCSVGEDFGLYFFTGAPIAFYRGSFPPQPSA